MIAGEGCTHCAPRPAKNDHRHFIAALSASSLYLSTNQTYRGQCYLIFDPRHVTRPDQLSLEEWQGFSSDLHQAEAALYRVTNPEHMNVAALGNVMPHLHWHIIPRYTSDPRWGLPIWPTDLADIPDTRLSEREQGDLIARIAAELAV